MENIYNNKNQIYESIENRLDLDLRDLTSNDLGSLEADIKYLKDFLDKEPK